MKVYEIVNPSDKVLLQADDELTACVATLLLGQGKYGLRDQAGETVLSIMIFGGSDEWLAEKGITDLAAWVTDHRAELAAVYESAFYGSANELAALELALADLPPDKRVAARKRYNEQKRTSMNNIGAACAYWAEHLRRMS